MLKEELKKVKIAVDSFLKDFFDGKKRGIGAVHPEVAKMIEDIEDVTLRGGDRFRPFMVWLGAQSAQKEFTNLRIYEFKNKKKSRDLIRIMACVELLHSFALIHDDIIDKAETRRGGPTIKPDEKAILAGDLCFVFADELLNGMPVAVKEIYDKLREEVIAGEWLDVWAAGKQGDMGKKGDKGVLEKIYEYKTARYTFLRPFEMGVEYAGGHGSPPLQKILIAIGNAFQMRDDYLDLFGDERLGKKIGGDLKEGKLTVWQVFGNKKLTQGSVEKVKEQMEKLGIKQKVEREMRRISDETKGMIEEIKELKGEGKELLMEMAEFVVEREY